MQMRIYVRYLGTLISLKMVQKNVTLVVFSNRLKIHDTHFVGGVQRHCLQSASSFEDGAILEHIHFLSLCHRHRVLGCVEKPTGVLFIPYFTWSSTKCVPEFCEMESRGAIKQPSWSGVIVHKGHRGHTGHRRHIGH